MGLFRKKPRDPRRHKIERFEGRWTATPGSSYPGIRGKIEWDGFASGDSEIDLFAHIPGMPDGDEVTLVLGDRVVMTVAARKGVVNRDLETKDGDDVPRLALQQVELRHHGVVIARTVLDPD